MMETPTTWIEVAGLTVIALGGWGKSWIDSRRHGRVVQGVSDELKNGHGTNLRDDLDEIRDAVHGIRDDQVETRQDLRGIRTDIIGIRGELRSERIARSDLQQLVDQRLRRDGENLWK